MIIKFATFRVPTGKRQQRAGSWSTIILVYRDPHSALKRLALEDFSLVPFRAMAAPGQPPLAPRRPISQPTH
ncbi:hypothetical protein Taro_055020 [Colocasia esculenta]|uniref:Uncharacterized protein n=1 Tax=Colocasia esculenta TaxID=4460 RepID=A0A843XS35_COLES|nr:hypothetical protein [Colocasia esculenta]